MNPIEVLRNYKGSDAEMTQASRIIHGLLVLDLPKFTAFDSTINAVFAGLFLTAIENADRVVADSAVVDVQTQKTGKIDEVMEKARGKYADVKYFAQKTFPTSIGTQNEFGVNDYERARKSPPQMIQFLDEMHKAGVKYQTQLVAKGLSAAAIAEIQTIRTELQAANTDQGIFKKQRPKMTEDRVIVLNKCFEFLTQINAAAQRVYKDDFAKRNQFVFSTSPENTTQEFTGEVASNSIKVVATIPFDAANVFTFSNTGLVPLVFCLSKTTTLEGIEIPIGGGATVTKLASELNADATNVLVKNAGATVGSFEVEVDN